MGSPQGPAFFSGNFAMRGYMWARLINAAKYADSILQFDLISFQQQQKNTTHENKILLKKTKRTKNNIKKTCKGNFF